MDWTWFLFRFDGRINRAKLWLSLVVVVAWMLVAAALVAGIGRLLGGQAAASFNLMDIFAVLDPDTYRSLTRTDLPSAAAHVILLPLFAWVFAAGTVKRLHDRDKSGWWAVPFLGLPGLVDRYADRLPGTILPMAIGGLAVVLSVWGFVELYCLAGVRRTNRFGPSPLPKAGPGGRSAERAPSRPAWDQHKQLAFTPHIGPLPWREAAIGSTSPPPNEHDKRRA
ncbi:DUF805 domain-containing protein [Bradyrhizobium sp. STM 3809]|uniref:DUF805 domain-containing protein n=1 Tax=Bradyrhizobium sp. STM 3809 TaxID=551936 RepID=UPI000240A2BF|nr:DUF805 domain-containing protein [Bradyrhizobium sp. STM 3809]CCE02369.1 conserved membrane hypothetical protein [Bradyrhizobium sp. STM 3809]